MDFKNTNPQYVQSSNRGRSLILITIVLIAVAGVLGYIFLKDRFIKKSETADSEITGLEIAAKTATFLDKTLQSDGGMLAGFWCPPDINECSPLEINIDQPHLGQAIYAYYLLAEATDDRSYRSKADKIMDFILNRCQTDVQMCVWNFFPLTRYYFDTKEDKYLQGMLRPAEQFLAMSNEDVIQKNVAHKLASLYQATGDERYKKRLLETANQSLSGWPLSTEKLSNRSIQIVWSVFVPAYAVTNDKRYLNASEQFFDSFNLAENFDKIMFADTLLKGIDALLSLAETSERGTIYKAQAHAALQEAMTRFWDVPGNLKITGDYGFLDIPESGYQARYKRTIINGWFVKSFIRVAEDMFVLPTNDN